MGQNQSSVQTDSRPYNLPSYRRPSNSRTSEPPIEAVQEGVKFHKDALFYDMSGDKFLIILNQHTFRKRCFRLTPSTRDGTENDECRLREVFYKLGFKIIVFRDFKYQKIIEYFTAIAALDHTRTSCICVAILTHGNKGGQISAADRPYSLSELIAIFEKVTSLINKPKLFFVQACRGGRMDPGHTVHVGSQSDNVLDKPSSSSSSSDMSPTCSEEETYKNMEDPRQVDSHFLGCCCLLDLFKDAGRTDRLRSERESVLTVPTHADTLVLRSTVEEFLSYRDTTHGSWMIQALCDTIEKNHEELNLLEMIIQMNRTVAYERITTHCKWQPMNNKKQMPEARFTLTKLVKF